MGHIENLLKYYSLLCNWADSEGLVFFSMVPKFHWLWHLGDKAKYLSPQKGNCMVDEDYMGTIKTMVRSCAHGTPSHNAPHAVFEKYRWGLYFLNQWGDSYRGAQP